MTIQLEYDPKKDRGRIICDYTEVLESIRQHFSVPDEGARIKAHKQGLRGNRLASAYSRRIFSITGTGRYRVGLTWEIVKFIKKSLPDFDITINQNLYKRLRLPINIEFVNNLRLEPRDYQYDAIQCIFKWGRGIIKIGTGGGKTYIIAQTAEHILRNDPSKRILIIVPSLHLVTQSFNDFDDYQCTFTRCMWSGKCDLPEQIPQVVITNKNILISQFERFSEWITQVDFVFIDEVHGLKYGNTICNVVESIITPFKVGFTGTLPPEKQDEWNVIGLTGSVIYEKPSIELRDEGTLTNVEVYGLCIKYKDIDIDQFNYRKELEFVNTSLKRHKIIGSVVNKFEKNALLLVNLIEHGENLEKVLNDMLPSRKVFFIRGDMVIDEREKIKQLMEERDDVVCIAMSSIFSTGINIKNLPVIVFCYGGKSFIRTIQSIGRGLRLHPNKNKLLIFDIFDSLKFSLKHFSERNKFYESEQIKVKQHTIEC